jgi:hypothetical protein
VRGAADSTRLERDVSATTAVPVAGGTVIAETAGIDRGEHPDRFGRSATAATSWLLATDRSGGTNQLAEVTLLSRGPG